MPGSRNEPLCHIYVTRDSDVLTYVVKVTTLNNISKILASGCLSLLLFIKKLMK